MIQTPFMAKYFYRKTRPQGEHAESYNKGVYKFFRKIISFLLLHKVKSIIISVLILIGAFASFKNIKMEFIPSPVSNQFFIEYNLPQGSDIDKVEDDLLIIQDFVQNLDGVNMTTTAIGRPPARYTLMRYMPTGGSNYGEIIIETENTERVDELIPVLHDYLNQNFPNAICRVHNYGAAFTDYDIEVEFKGPDPKILRELGEKTRQILSEEPTVESINNNWWNKTKTLNPKYNITKAQALGLSRSDMSNSLLIATDGMPIGAFYKGDDLVPVILKLENHLSENMDGLLSTPVWGQNSKTSVPLSQIVDTIAIEWKNEIITRMDGTRALRIQFDGIEGIAASDLQANVYDKINSIPLPHGYHLSWEGEVTASGEANGSLFKFLPMAIGLMLIIIVALFNSIKQALIIFIIVPFAFVGVAIGFNITGLSLTFLAIIGCLGLIGMMIKNSIVLLNQINIEVREGKSALHATIDSAVSRVRPVMMASLTTVLGMLPLLTDKMFQSMAVAIMFGLAIGSIITLVVVPILYAVFFKVDIKELRRENRNK